MESNVMGNHHSMTNPRLRPEATDGRQKDMAVSLLHELGYDQAVSVCCAHGWKGTLLELSELVDANRDD